MPGESGGEPKRDWVNVILEHPVVIAATDAADKFVFSQFGKAVAESTGVYQPEAQIVKDDQIRALRPLFRLFTPLASKMLEANGMQTNAGYFTALGMDNLINTGIIAGIGLIAAENPSISPSLHIGLILSGIYIRNFLVYYGFRKIVGEPSTAPVVESSTDFTHTS